MGFNVAEGELVLKGDSMTSFTCPKSVMIGMSTSNGTEEPALTLDGVDASFSERVHLGSFQTTSSFSRRPRLVIRNGANVSIGTYIAGRNMEGADFVSSEYPTTIVENATVNFASLRGSYSWRVHHTLLATNSTILCNVYESYGPNSLEVTGGVMQKNAAGDCFTATMNSSGEGNWQFKGGAKLSLSRFFPAGPFLQYTIGLKVAFDGATWETGGGTQPTFHLHGSTNFVFQTTGAGLTLPVAGGKTVNVARAITGDGPLVKTGAGSLVFETQGSWDSTITTKTALADPVSLAFAGELDVREGTVSVESGACRAGGAYRAAPGASVDFGNNALGDASFAGAGSFSNFSASGATIVSDGVGADVPSFSSALLSGVTCIDFGRSDELPINWQEVKNVPVARFSGSVPNVSRWKVSGTGMKNIAGEFSVAEDGVVCVTLVRRGITIVVF